jgi:uncharacterized protein with WD repeat
VCLLSVLSSLCVVCLCWLRFSSLVQGIPVEEIEFDKKDAVIAFAWQPSGSMFAVIHGRAPKPDVSIYGVKKAS